MKKPTPAQAAVLNAGLDHPDTFHSSGTYPFRTFVQGVRNVTAIAHRSLESAKWVAMAPRRDGRHGAEPHNEEYPYGASRWYVTEAGAAAVGRTQNPALLAEMDRRIALREQRDTEAAKQREAARIAEERDRRLHAAAPLAIAFLRDLDAANPTMPLGMHDRLTEILATIDAPTPAADEES
jgi:hypothetical protein